MIYVVFRDYGREGYGEPLYYFHSPLDAIRYMKEHEEYSSSKYPHTLMDYDKGLFEFRKSISRRSDGWIIMKLECGQDGNAVVC